MKSINLEIPLFRQLSLPVRGAWVEIFFRQVYRMCGLSLPVRGAWVEMPVACDDVSKLLVAPRAGSVG